MKKRHVTELTGRELESVFKAAVVDAWASAAERHVDAFGHDDEGRPTLRKPDGRIVEDRSTEGGAVARRKSAAG